MISALATLTFIALMVAVVAVGSIQSYRAYKRDTQLMARASWEPVDDHRDDGGESSR
jgi:heme/copper-type cytochrome/quinol oxidase subunit 2